MRSVLWFLPLLILTPDPAAAAALGGLVTSIASGFGASAIGQFVLRTAASFALNALANALLGKQNEQKAAGISTSITTTGGTTPQKVVFGRYATAGHKVCPDMTHGTNGDTVDYLTYVIDVSDHPIHELDAVFIDSEKCVFTTPGNRYGETANSNTFTNRAWLRWHDGRQTTADSMLVDVYGNYPRPWTEDHLLTGVAYAVLTFKFDEKKTQGFPDCRFELRGARLYDPRKDSTVGGVGGHRWNDQETWQFTENPVVMIYSILRGLTLSDGSIYGLNVPAAGLPLDRWAAAMNVCDEVVETYDGPEARYKAGLEFSVDSEPLNVIQELLTACGGQIAETGGSWNIVAGPAVMPRAHFTDDDIIISKDREAQPYRGLKDTFNGCHATYPAPFALWEPKDAPPLYNPAWEAEDEGRRLMATLNLNAVTSGYQAQRLMLEMLSDNRRWITHTLTLPPTALGLLPLDTISWTSDINGYTGKLFEIVSKTVDAKTLCVSLQLRERSNQDYEYSYLEVTEPLLVSEGPWNPADGAGEEPEENYTDPVTTQPLEVVQPSPVPASLVAIHPAAVSETTNGGHTWRQVRAPFLDGREISAVRNQGYLMRTLAGEGWWAPLLEEDGFVKLRFEDAAGVEVLQNGGFENGLTDWTTVLGSPSVLETSNPPQVGGQAYITGRNAWRIEQAVTIPADQELRFKADTYLEPGASAKIGVRTLGADGSNQYLSFGNQGTTFDEGTSLTAPFGGGFDLRVTLLNAGGDTVTLGGSDYGNLGFVTNAISTQWRIELLKNGVAQAGVPYRVGFWDLDNAQSERIEVYGAIQGVTPSGSQVSINPISGGFRLQPNDSFSSYTQIEGAAYVDADDEFTFTFRSDGGPRGFVLRPRPAGDAGTGVVHERTLTATSGWQSVSLDIDMGGITDAVVFVESVSGRGWFDNLSLSYGEPGSQALVAVASDTFYSSRRHLAATATDLFQVVGGEPTRLGTLPFTPTVMAGHGDTVIVANDNSVALSEDGGVSWTTHAIPTAASQVHARPATVILEDGNIYSVTTSATSPQSSLAGEHWVERYWPSSNLNINWWAVDDSSGEALSGNLLAWSSAIDMPVGGLFGYRIVSTDDGRIVGWRYQTRDLFNLDPENPVWTVSPAFKDTAYDIKEVR